MTTKWMQKLTSDFGKAAADLPSPSAHVIKLPSPSLNWAVGNGGFTRGKAICFFGAESGGKSLLMQLVLIQLQQDFPDGIVVLIDAEFSFNKDWFKKLGGDLDRLYVRQTNDPVKIFDWIMGEMLEMLQNGAPIVGLAIDSVKAIRYPKDVKKITTAMTMGGGGASYLGSTLKGVLPIIREYEITTILVQQVYEEMDEYKKMNNPWKIPDGMAMKHFCDYMLCVERIDTKAGRIESGKNVYGGDQQVGHKVRIKSKKNRVGAPYRCAEFSLNYEKGIVDVGGEIFALAKTLKIIGHPLNEETGKENTMMWKFGSYPAIRGEANMLKWVVENDHLWDQIMEACYNVKNESILDERNRTIETEVIPCEGYASPGTEVEAGDI